MFLLRMMPLGGGRGGVREDFFGVPIHSSDWRRGMGGGVFPVEDEPLLKAGLQHNSNEISFMPST